MASWRLVPSLASLRSEFDRVFPGRKKGKDGSIGDEAHARTESDHNPDGRGLVHAIDVTADLGGTPMIDVIDEVVSRCRSGAEKRLTYIIFCPPGGEPTIWSARRGWKPKTYTGSNRHEGHAHFSADDAPALENSQKPWHLEDAMALSPEDKKWLTAEIKREVGALVKATDLEGADGKPDGTKTTLAGHHVLSQGVPNPLQGGRRTPFYELIADVADRLAAPTAPAKSTGTKSGGA
jgi:hypothetical protein